MVHQWRAFFENSQRFLKSRLCRRWSASLFWDGPLLLGYGNCRILLLISAPQQSWRKDFHSRTSNIDLLPTLVNIGKKEPPVSLAGRPLPGFGGAEDASRSNFAVEAKTNSAFAPLKRARITLMKENSKIIYYGDYSRYSNIFELYDLYDDIDEKKGSFCRGSRRRSLAQGRVIRHPEYGK